MPTDTMRASRTPWKGDERAMIVASIREVKQHPAYEAAKTGDPAAAIDLAQSFLSPAWIARHRKEIAAFSPILLGVHAVEGVSVNMIAQGLAATLADTIGLPLDTAIVQITRAGHTGASGWKRLGLSAETLKQLRDKHGNLESWWCDRFGFGFESLTESEARYLLRAEDADSIRARLADAE